MFYIFLTLNKNFSILQKSIKIYQISFNNMNIIILLSLVTTCAAIPIYLVPTETMFGHPAVLINSEMEDNLPNQLRNDFYKHPDIAANLAKESWFVEKEMQVLFLISLTMKDFIIICQIRRK